MKLIKYLVTSFRSVKNSGWIDSGDVTALIGVNESGKTNLLLPLWKLNPAREGTIQPTSDYPKRMFGEIRANPAGYAFITAEFETGDIAGAIANLVKVSADQLDVVSVSRFYDGHYVVSFPNHQKKNSISGLQARDVMDSLRRSLDSLNPLKPEEIAKTVILQEVGRLYETCDSDWNEEKILSAVNALKKPLPETPAKTSTLVPCVAQTVEKLEGWLLEIRSPAPEQVDGVQDLVLKSLPKFVYYSNYGNLDSEIYLPHVVQNLKRTDLGAKEESKARTLRILFDFVRLEPKEILELGLDFKEPGREPTSDEVAKISEKKRERSILLQSAGTKLTDEFKDWWKQGNYRFRFEADGNHFRIWVSDTRRPEEVELESRSTGLQWFLSFFLVFLVESEGNHRNAVLLLDEPGLSLHPLAQRDLSLFFDGLAPTNQILYATHSPFLVHADRLDRVRKVFMAMDGSTESSSNLRQVGADPAQAGAAYAVYSALNLNVSESLLLGCAPVVVEGQSDQHYLTLIKALLIGSGKISPRRELVFPPTGGTKTLRLTASILTGRDEKLPVILLDGDEMGSRMAKELSTNLYATESGKILSTDDFSGFKGSELEDLIPLQSLAAAIDKIFRDSEQQFAEVMKKGSPVIPQIEAWAKAEKIPLHPGWKVDVAKRVKQTALPRGIQDIDDGIVDQWVKLFNQFELQTTN